MPIDQLTQLELFAKVFEREIEAETGPSEDATQESCFAPPSPELTSPVVSLADALGDGPDLLTACRRDAERKGAQRTAQVIGDIATILKQTRGDLQQQEMRQRKFVRFVYPVV